jgi:predicted RNase H-like HicB family nuclease
MRNTDLHYEMVVYWKDEFQSYTVEVPELVGCRASGKTRTDAVFQAENAIAVWIETARLSGDPIPQPQGRLAFH